MLAEKSEAELNAAGGINAFSRVQETGDHVPSSGRSSDSEEMWRLTMVVPLKLLRLLKKLLKKLPVPCLRVRRLRRTARFLLFGALFSLALLVAARVWGRALTLKSWAGVDVLDKHAENRWDLNDYDIVVGEDEKLHPASWRPEYKGEANLHVFEDWCGSSTEQLRRNLHFPLYPHLRTTVRKLAVSPRWINYGLRIFGYLHPFEDGEYLFAVASDDNSEFWLSHDESPMNLQLLAYVGKTGTEWTAPGEFGKYTSQISHPVQLEMGKRYYFEIIYKQNDQGTDHVEVAWRLNHTGLNFKLINSMYISLYVNESALKMNEVEHIPQSVATRVWAPAQSMNNQHPIDMLQEDPRDSFYQLPLINEEYLRNALPYCSYSPSYLIKGFPLRRYQGLHFVHLSYVYPNDYTRLTQMENDNKCFYHENSDLLERFGFYKYMKMDNPEMEGAKSRKWTNDMGFINPNDEDPDSDVTDDEFFEDQAPHEKGPEEMDVLGRPNNQLNYKDNVYVFKANQRFPLASWAKSGSRWSRKLVNRLHTGQPDWWKLRTNENVFMNRNFLVMGEPTRSPRVHRGDEVESIKGLRRSRVLSFDSSVTKAMESPLKLQVTMQLFQSPYTDRLRPQLNGQISPHVHGTKHFTAGTDDWVLLRIKRNIMHTTDSPENGATRGGSDEKMAIQNEAYTGGANDQLWIDGDDNGRVFSATQQAAFDHKVNWAQTFEVSPLNFHLLRTNMIDLQCNVSGNLLLSSADALSVVKAFMHELNQKNQGRFYLVHVVNVEKKRDGLFSARYLLELELQEQDGTRLRLSEYIYVIWHHQHMVEPEHKVTEPLICQPLGFSWTPSATVHFVVPVKNQARWVQQFIVDMEALYRVAQDKNFNIIIVDFSSNDMDVELALKNSALPGYQYVKLSGNFERSAGLQAGINLITDDHSIVFLCDLHIHFPSSIIDSIRKHCVEGKMAFAPVVLRLDCGSTPQDPRGYWEVNGFGLLAIYKSDLDSVGGMNTREFRDHWGGEDWELLDRILQSGLEVERIYLKNFMHHHHSKRGMWNRSFRTT